MDKWKRVFDVTDRDGTRFSGIVNSQGEAELMIKRDFQSFGEADIRRFESVEEMNDWAQMMGVID